MKNKLFFSFSPLSLVAAAIALQSAFAPNATAGIQSFSEDFESPAPGWFFTGGAGLDANRGLAHRGQGNAWVRYTQGWNAVNRWIAVPSNSDCSLQVWLRMSPNVTAGYLSVRNDKENRPDHNFDVINERKLVGPGPSNPANNGYSAYTFTFNSGANSRVLFYVGLWGNGSDGWIQIDDLGLGCQTPY